MDRTNKCEVQYVVRFRMKDKNTTVKDKNTTAKVILPAVEKENIVEKEPDMAEEDGTGAALPVPQVTIGPDGNIVINEKR